MTEDRQVSPRRVTPIGPGRAYPGLHLKCWLLLVYIRATLTLRSYTPILERIRRLDGTADTRRSPFLYAWAISRSARFVPGASCLTQSLAMRWLMARSDQSCTLRIGVMTTPSQEFRAHAWVLHNNALLLGGNEPDLEKFTPIVDL